MVWDGRERRVNSVLTPKDLELVREVTKDQAPRYFGFKVPEIAVILSILMAVAAFYFRTNDAIIDLKDIASYARGFMQNSDNYHSAALGTEFRQGKPANPSYDVREGYVCNIKKREVSR